MFEKKLTDKDLEEIRSYSILYRSMCSAYSPKALAKKYGVNASTISIIANYGSLKKFRSWKRSLKLKYFT